MEIIIVEDEKIDPKRVGKDAAKAESEYEVVGLAKNGLDGYRQIRDESPDLVILDIEMPEMDGLTMLEKLREIGFRGKAVVLTAYADFSYAKRAIELGIENYLLKPIKIEELRKTLDDISQSLKQESEQRMCRRSSCH